MVALPVTGRELVRVSREGGICNSGMVHPFNLFVLSKSLDDGRIFLNTLELPSR